MSCKIYVNGNERQLHWSVGFLNYDRCVKLSNLPYRQDYQVVYLPLGDMGWTPLGSGVLPLEDMLIEVRAPAPPTRHWFWRLLWPD